MSILDEPYLRDFPDRAIRKLLEYPAHLRDLVAQVAPDLAPRFDFARLERVEPREFLLEDWRRRELDLLFRVPYRCQADEQAVLVCVLVEHQSAPDPRMPLRVLLYTVLYWEREWKEWESRREADGPLRLTPVLPIVFHTGATVWRSHRTLAELIEGPEALRRLAPHWPLLMWDLAERSPQQLLLETSQWLRALAVVRAEKQPRRTFQAVFTEALRGLQALAHDEHVRWEDLAGFVLSWALKRRPPEEREAIHTIAVKSQTGRQRQREVKKMSETVKQTWDEWMLERGMAQGMAQGRLEGEIAACQETLRAQLVERFGKIPARLAKRIEATKDLDLLKKCLRQVVHIKSVAELKL
jgi:hypothetical protein